MTLAAKSFNGNLFHTLGVEVELQLVDAKTMELKSSVTQILEAMDEIESDWIKPEPCSATWKSTRVFAKPFPTCEPT